MGKHCEFLCGPSSGMPGHPPAQWPANRICYFKSEYAVTFGTKTVQTFSPDKARWAQHGILILAVVLEAVFPQVLSEASHTIASCSKNSSAARAKTS